jgi:hypothetical protein
MASFFAPVLFPVFQLNSVSPAEPWNGMLLRCVELGISITFQRTIKIIEESPLGYVLY